VAPDVEGAKALIAHWAGSYAGTFVRVDVTGASGLSSWVSGLGLADVGGAVTMAYNGVPPSDGTVQQFAIINQALC
jgi:hypothetical protein